tara:strand:+ start:724 stop:1410 length:687 start_codon:yes stop_codon:yes gene_type:complete
MQSEPKALHRCLALAATFFVHAILLATLLWKSSENDIALDQGNNEEGVTILLSIAPAPSAVSQPALPLSVRISPATLPVLESSLRKPVLNLAAEAATPNTRQAMSSTQTALQGPTPAKASDGQKSISAASCMPRAWLESVSSSISHDLRYPRYSRELQHRGTAYLRMSIARDGAVLESDLLRGSGYELLDIEARDVIRRIGRFRPVPSEACKHATVVVVDQPIVFGHW